MLSVQTRRAIVARIATSVGRDRASRLTAVLARVEAAKFNPRQQRDDHGRWADGGPNVPNMPSGPSYGGGDAKGKGSGSRYAESQRRMEEGMTPSNEGLMGGPLTPPKPILPGQHKLKTIEDVKEFQKRWDFGGPQWNDMSIGERERMRDLAKSLAKFSPKNSESILKSMDRLDDLLKNPPKAPDGMNPAGMTSTTEGFHGTHNQKDHGHWADFPSGHVPKGKSIADDDVNSGSTLEPWQQPGKSVWLNPRTEGGLRMQDRGKKWYVSKVGITDRADGNTVKVTRDTSSTSHVRYIKPSDMIRTSGEYYDTPGNRDEL